MQSPVTLSADPAPVARYLSRSTGSGGDSMPGARSSVQEDFPHATLVSGATPTRNRRASARTDGCFQLKSSTKKAETRERRAGFLPKPIARPSESASTGGLRAT